MDDVALPPSATLPGVTDAERARTFTDWMRAHGPALRRVASSYAHTPAEQEDLLQQIALALWQALPGFRGECGARTFVYRVAHNQGAHFATRERLRRTHPDGDIALDALADERPDPERALDARRRQGRLFEAIRALPVSHRQVITLALEDLPHDEIAAVLGITVNNVNVRLSRARDALRARWALYSAEPWRAVVGFGVAALIGIAVLVAQTRKLERAERDLARLDDPDAGG